MKKNQRTIRKSVELEGVGLFTGAPARLRLIPAQVNSGVAFIRADLPNRPRLPVRADTVASKFRRTMVQADEIEIETVEHLMSALGGLGIDNLDIELNAAEVPNIDGSSAPFVELLTSAGLEDQAELRKVLTVRDTVTVSEKDVHLVALPSENGLTINYTLNYPGTPIGMQHLSMDIDEERYRKELAPARTFCLESEAQALQAQGLGKGGTVKNTLIVGKDGPIDNPLRFPDEYVRHKVLDLLGDLSILGGELRAHIVAVGSGHTTNVRLVKRLAETFEAGPALARKQETLLDVREITKILPHRFPFLLIDKVIEMDGYRRAVGIKNVTYNEPYFQGHFPDQPIMPGVLQIEAMAQLAGALLMRKAENQAKVAVLLSLDAVKLRKSVVPGDQLRIEVETLKIKARTGEVFTRASVDGQVVAEANMKFMLMDTA
ncbi:MAG: UDP-3-O-[3-hydroxymyristoyl] N-acetylglucosamine deacetylase [Planctomycetes bacterium]|nr:UDP-3-O-[3-hydroxymyristoyl] N-acetylglucosamine deacetylase [Planctomycetota bacterium]